MLGALLRRRHRFDVTIYSPWLGPLLVPGATPAGGGAETQLSVIARTLARRGYRVCLVVYGEKGEIPDVVDGVHVRTQRMRTYRLRPMRGLTWIVRSVRALTAANADVFVQRAAGRDTAMVALVAKLCRSRFVHSTANIIDFSYERLEPKPHNVRLFHLGVRLADRVVVQTEEQEELCKRRFGRSPSVIKSIAEPAPQRNGVPDAFLWIARYAPYKRPLDYVELARAVPEARFRLVGVVAGPYADEIEKVVVDAASDVPNLEILPARARAALMPEIDRAVAIVNTAEYEGMPNIFLEGWARGVPALALYHDPDGVIEREGVGGFAQSSMERFADLAREMWNARDDQRDLAARCRAYVRRDHELDVVVDAWREALGLPPAESSR